MKKISFGKPETVVDQFLYFIFPVASEEVGAFLLCEECNYTTNIDENDMFSVNQAGMIQLAKLLDYDIIAVYRLHLYITTTTTLTTNYVNTYDATITVHINDVINWPPLFNESCNVNTNYAMKSKDAVLYDVYVGYGKDRKPLEEMLLLKDKTNLKQSFNADSYNGNCNARLYFGGHHTVKYFQNYRIMCDTVTQFSPEFVSPDDSALTGNPYVSKEWFPDYNLVVVVGILHMITSTDSGFCKMIYHPLNVVVTDIKVEVVPQGFMPTTDVENFIKLHR
ncbi:uncharacterized protein LOC144437456 [Glandiceps talaboti]